MTLSGIFVLYLNRGMRSPLERVKMKEPVIILDDGAKEIGLAVMLSDLIRQNLEQKPEKIDDFNALDAKVLIEARDVQIVVGLEFKQGNLTVSKGSFIKPDLHIITDSTTVLDLCFVKIKFGLPYFFDANGSKILKKILAK
ncbi:MAG: hypothetical protein ACXU93_14725, partial [Thermodesulfobacteriota bacterium]